MIYLQVADYLGVADYLVADSSGGALLTWFWLSLTCRDKA